MYYGNTSATDHQQATSVWDSNYVGTWHLKEDPSGTAPQMQDSTTNNYDGTSSGSMTSTDQVSGQINGSLDFDGVDDYVDVGDISTADWTNLTAEAWVYWKANGLNGYAGVYFKNSLGDIGRLLISDAGKILIQNGNGNFFSNSDGDVSKNIWTNIVYVYNQTLGQEYIYVNNVLKGQKARTGNIPQNATSMWIGFGYSQANNYMFPGIIDEVRVSNSARSAAWIAASYKSETDAFNTFNSEEERYVSSGTLTSSIFDTEQQSNWGTLTYNTDGVATTTVKARTSNSSSMAGATDFSSCNAITSGSDISSNNCVTDTHRYIQYQIALTSVSANTPTFQDVSIAFTASDSTQPSISLTALSPDPNNDNTPSLTGTATDAAGTVSNVQFQMDGTSGSWTACTADDGSFDEATETFTCTPSALSDGSHTIYVRATDSNSNTTASGSESSDTFTIDATAPTSIDLDSPGDNSYTSNERPTFKWKATSDATAGLSKYVLEIDNPSAGSGQATGDFTIDDIPTSRTTDYETNKYVIHYENFSDSDSTNNYISVYTKSHSDWGSSENDGKLREGKVSWKVKARDNAGNETSSSRTLFVDRTGPKVEFTQVNDTPFSSTNFSTTDKTPTIYGKITDSLAGGDSGQSQNDDGPKIASGPKQVEIKVEKKEGLGYKLHTLYTINMDKPWYTCDGKEVSDNSKQKCDKYLPFEYTSKENLELGTYKITLTGKDKADNSSGETTLTLNITTFAQITTPEEKKIIEEKTKPLKPEEKEKVKEELEITKPTEEVPVSTLEKVGQQISQASKNILNTTGNFISAVFNGIGQGVRFTFDITGKALAFVGDKILRPAQDGAGQALALVGRTASNAAMATNNTIAAWYNGTKSILAYVGEGVGNGARIVGQELARTGGKIGQGIGNTGKAASNATAAGNFIGGVANNAGKTTSTIAQNTAKTIGNIANSIASTTSTIAKNTGSAIASATQNTVNGAKEGIAKVFFAIGEKTQDVSNSTAMVFLRIGYSLLTEDTKISNVESVALSPTSVKITWKTNHPANGKVNWGYEDGIYKFDLQESKRTTEHEFILTNLQPNTVYHYEVMSQNKNYVYDANRKFRTPAIAGQETNRL